jgi:hypothetical protein
VRHPRSKTGVSKFPYPDRLNEIFHFALLDADEHNQVSEQDVKIILTYVNTPFFRVARIGSIESLESHSAASELGMVSNPTNVRTGSKADITAWAVRKMPARDVPRDF